MPEAAETTRCPGCGYENPPDGRFCGECGISLTGKCEHCGRENPAGQRFCNGCGAELGGSGGGAAATRREPPSLPGHLAERARREAAELVGERKQVTILFCDLESSMERSQRLDPDAWHELMDRFFRLIAACVHRYEGTIDKFTGDGAMAIFGAPIAHEDHAQRACRAALALREELAGLDAELCAAGQGEFPVRIGLNSGEVVVASVGEGGQMEYTAHGHAVGLAQRIETTADARTIAVSASTARLVGEQFELSELGAREFKGHDRPVAVFELRRALPGATALATQPNRLSAFAGRDRELGQLTGALERAGGGESQVVGVVGEPGVGKSRLLLELSERARARGIPVRSAHGVPYGRGVPYLPVLELLRGHLGIEEAEPDEARAKVATEVRSLAPDLEDELPLLLDFLGVADPGRPAEELDAEARRRRIFAAAKRLLHGRSDEGTMLLLLEDLHWFDAASLALAEELIAIGPGARTMVVLSFRPEFEPPFAARSDYTQLPLRSLGAEAVAAIVASRAGRDPSLDGLAERLAERTDGNPLFCEEMLASLVEGGELVGEPGAYRLARELGELRIPDTVQAVLAARIDRLAPAEKRTLQAASVIGRSFSDELLAAVAELDETALAASIRELSASELVFERAPGRREHEFKHVLTRDVAYASLLQRDRRELHGRVAGGIERLYPERLDERAALISDHHERAGDPIAAGRWAARGAEWAAPLDVDEAVRLGRRAGALLADADDQDEELLGVRLGALMRAAQGASRMRLAEGEDEAVFEEPRALAKRAGNIHVAVLATIFHGAHHLFGGRAERAVELGGEALELARQSGDRELELAALLAPASGYVATGRPRELLETCEHGLGLAGGDLDFGVALMRRSPTVNLLWLKASALAMLGRLDEGMQVADEAVEKARARQGELENLAWALSARAVVENFAGGDPGADAAESFEVGRRMGSRASEAYALVLVVAGANRRGDFEEAERRARTALDAFGTPVGFAELDLLLGRATALTGLGDSESVAVAEEAVRIGHAIGTRAGEGRALLALLEALRAYEPDRARAEAEPALQRIEELARVAELGFLPPHVAEQRGELALMAGEALAARQQLERAGRGFEEIGARGHARRIAERLELLAGAEPASGR
jgi:class 3 adenylate cyclase/tetratricopeptide (TPR) repeat protein